MNEKNKGTAEGVPRDPNIASYVSSIIWPSPLAPARAQALPSSLISLVSCTTEGVSLLNMLPMWCFQIRQAVRMNTMARPRRRAVGESWMKAENHSWNASSGLGSMVMVWHQARIS